ncbi:ABC transporter permease subunit [Clostridium sp. JNZ X4-2]
MLLKIIENELIKICHKKKLIVCFILMCLVFTASFFFFNKDRGEGGLANNKRIEKYYMEQKKNSKDPSVIKEAQEHVDEIETGIREYQLDKSHPDSWKSNLEKQIAILEKTSKGKSISNPEYKALQLKEYKYLLKNNLKPLNSLSTTGFTFFLEYVMLLSFSMIIIFLIAAIITSDILSSEYTPATLKFILLRPVSKAKLIWGKFFAGVISSSALVIFFYAAVYVFGGIKYGFDSFKYPVTIGPSFKYSAIKNMTYNKFIEVIPGTSTLIPLYKFLGEFALLQILFIIASVSFCVLMSTLFKNSAVAVSSTILFGGVFIFISKMPGFLSDKSYITSAFFLGLSSPLEIITRSFVQKTGAYYINTLSAAVIMIGWTVLFLGLSIFIFQRREEYI